MSEGRYTISELVDRTGVPAATIHHYRSLDLLPSPDRVATNRFVYTERHLQAIKLIRLLRERRRLPLEVIGQVLPELLAGDDDEAFRPETWTSVLAGRDTQRGSRTIVVDAAAELFSRRGYAEVSVSDIAEAAGVAKGTVYRHVSSKEELFIAAVESAVESTLSRFAAAASDLGAPVDAPTAAKLFGPAVRPAMPLLLELAARAAQGHADHAAGGRRVLDALLEGVGSLVTGPASARERGAEAVQGAIVDAFRAAVPPDEQLLAD